MRVYVDTSVVLRVLFREPHPIAGWGQWAEAYSSRIWRVEARRAVDRARLAGSIDDPQVAQLRSEIEMVDGALHIVPVFEGILHRAEEAFPTVIGTLDAIHLACALAVRDSIDVFLTHDSHLAIAAEAVGFDVQGT